MASTGKIENNNKRQYLSKKYSEKRKKIRMLFKSQELSNKEIFDLKLKAQKLPRNSSETRYRNRCSCCGRPRSYIRDFGLCRSCFRDKALKGELPGVTKGRRQDG